MTRTFFGGTGVPMDTPKKFIYYFIALFLVLLIANGVVWTIVLYEKTRVRCSMFILDS